MKYINVAEILPERLLKEIPIYADGESFMLQRSPQKRVGSI